MPAVGTPPAVVTPTLTAPVPPPPPGNLSPTVESYDVQAYHCQAADTLQSLSLKFYNSEKYDQALLLFNRSHPLGADALRHDPATLQPGLVLYIPQMKVLEKRYPASIRDLTPLQPVVPAVATTGPLPTPHLYQVRVGGEKVRDIAQRVLGNPERYQEICTLNPRMDVSFVTAGQQLWLPADAHIDAADVPR